MMGSPSGFHSISFPSEWGDDSFKITILKRTPFPFNQFPQRVGSPIVYSYYPEVYVIVPVSIQLVSPASGEKQLFIDILETEVYSKFPFNQFPQRVGRFCENQIAKAICFHSISFPSEWGVRGDVTNPPTKKLRRLAFPFNQFPQRVGRLYCS